MERRRHAHGRLPARLVQMRKRVRHPEQLRLPHVGGPRPPFKSRWSIFLANQSPRTWVPRGHEPTRDEALARLRDLLASDRQGLYSNGWIKQSWERT